MGISKLFLSKFSIDSSEFKMFDRGFYGVKQTRFIIRQVFVNKFSGFSL